MVIVRSVGSSNPVTVCLTLDNLLLKLSSLNPEVQMGTSESLGQLERILERKWLPPAAMKRYSEKNTPRVGTRRFYSFH